MKLNASHHINFKNYRILRTDRPLAVQGGGTAIVYSENLQLTPCKCSFASNFKLIEVTVGKLKLKNQNVLYIISMYVTNSNLSIFKNELDVLFNP